MDNAVIISLCIIPSLLLLWYIYIKDKVEKEPIYLLILLFLGGIIACTISIFLSILSKQYIYFLNFAYTDMNIFQIIFKVLFSIVVIEEGSKWIISYTIWNNKNFNHLYDPIVYCTFVAMGFATLENIIYGFTFSTYGIIPIIMRGLISVPSHAVFGIFMGYYLGISKNAALTSKLKQSKKYKLLSFIIPTYLHLVYNLFLVKKNFIMYSIFIIYIIVIYLLAYQKIKKLSSIHKTFSLKEKDISKSY